MNGLIASSDNDSVKSVAKLLKDAKYRKKCGCFVCEGVRLCRDGILSGRNPLLFLYTKEAAEKYREDFMLVKSAAERCVAVKKSIFNTISDTVSPQGFLCLFKMLDKKIFLDTIISNQGSYIALENIQDPSNMGTILRTAEAFGIDGVILSPNCCDVYSPKVLRGSMGAIFRLPFLTEENFCKSIRALTDSGVHTYASMPRAAVSLVETDFSKGGVVLIGNEGNGLSREAAAACKTRLTIPMKGSAESLNVAAAAAVLIWKLTGG